MKVLIIGVSGFIGRRLYSLLEREKISVYGVSRRRRGFKGAWFNLDVTNSEAVKEFMSEHDFDMIIHLGGPYQETLWGSTNGDVFQG